MRIIQFGIPRSGSTLVWQIMKECLFSHIQKIHGYILGSHVICTYRDFRDCVVSNWRIFADRSENQKLTEEEIKGYCEHVLKSVRALNKYKKFEDRTKMAFLKYEDFVNKPDMIFDALEKVFDFKISKEKRINLTNEFSFKKNTQRSLKFKTFGEWDDKTGIHGKHIFKGEVEGWKKFIKDEDRALLHEYLGKDLKKWGYIDIG